MVTPEEFAKLMQEFADNSDTEEAHGQADDLMCEVLEAWGYKEGVKIFREMNKWYA